MSIGIYKIENKLSHKKELSKIKVEYYRLEEIKWL